MLNKITQLNDVGVLVDEHFEALNKRRHLFSIIIFINWSFIFIHKSRDRRFQQESKLLLNQKDSEKEIYLRHVVLTILKSKIHFLLIRDYLLERRTRT